MGLSVKLLGCVLHERFADGFKQSNLAQRREVIVVVTTAGLLMHLESACSPLMRPDNTSLTQLYLFQDPTHIAIQVFDFHFGDPKHHEADFVTDKPDCFVTIVKKGRPVLSVMLDVLGSIQQFVFFCFFFFLVCLFFLLFFFAFCFLVTCFLFFCVV